MDKNQIKSTILDCLEPMLDNGRFFVVDTKISLSKIVSRITLLMDSDEGIKIDECAEISRSLGAVLEEKDLFEGNYNIEVSSPGVETPLKFARQYPRNIGRTLQVTLLDGNQKTGKLTEADTEKISLIEDKKRKKGEEITPLVFNYTDIKESFTQISFK